MSSSTRHQDFGEKIGGAKKDLWRERGLYADDLNNMNDREADAFVKKDNVWKKPDYAAMIEGGVPSNVAFFIKQVRDSLPPKPQFYQGDDTPEKRSDRLREYIETIREVQGAVEGVTTREEAMGVFGSYLIGEGYIEKRARSIGGHQYVATEKAIANAAINNKLLNTMLISSVTRWEWQVQRKAEKAKFGVKAQTGATARRKPGKTRLTPPQLQHIRRDGPDYRQGRDATGEMYLDTFSFKGGEFGNWMDDRDRQASLNMGFDALKDLAAALQIDDRDIAYQGRLSIAFGARGSGSAAAHYEPMRQVINLTKMHGAGSLAHEWWHGLDDYLGRKYGAGDLLSHKPQLYAPMEKLLASIKFKSETLEQAQQKYTAQRERILGSSGRRMDNAMGAVLRRGDETLNTQYAQLKAEFLAGEKGAVDKLSEWKKTVTGHVIPKTEREQLQIYEGMLAAYGDRAVGPQIGRVATDYLRQSKEMGNLHEKDGGYWDSNEELTARAFACYVMDRVGSRSDYLVGHAESCISIKFDDKGNSELIKAYPEGEERIAINAAFNQLFAELKQERVLTHSPRRSPELGPGPGIAQISDPGAEASYEQLSFDNAQWAEEPDTGQANQAPASKTDEVSAEKALSALLGQGFDMA